MLIKRLMNVKNPRNFLIVWFVFATLGFSRISFVFASVAVKLMPIRSIQFRLLEWASASGSKPVELLQYGFSMLFLFCVFVVLYRWLLQADQKITTKAIDFFLEDSHEIYLYLYFLSLLWVTIMLIDGSRLSFFLSTGWFILIITPVFPLINMSHWTEQRQNRIFMLVMVILSLSLFMIFYPLIGKRPFILNDYMDIPEQTLLDGQYVDNASYINTHNIGGILKYDPRTNKGVSPIHPDLCASVTHTSNLEDFISLNRYKYFYDHVSHLLTITGPMTKIECEALLGIVSPSEKPRIIQMFTRSSMHYNNTGEVDANKAQIVSIKNYNSSEYNFITKNGFELRNQALAGHFFHHHNYQLGPLNERVLGKEPSKILYVYGLFSSVILEKTMNILGGISFNNYFHASFLYYFIYYVLLTAAVAIVVRDIRFVCLFLIIQLGAIYIIGYELIQMAPGFNPLRHFLDPFVLLFLYMFAKHRRQFYLLGSLSFAIASILMNKEFGIFIFGSLMASVLFAVIHEKTLKHRYTNYVIVALGILAALISMAVFKQRDNSLFIYTLVGVSLPPLTTAIFYPTMIIFIISYIYIVKLNNEDNYLKYVLLYLLLYTQSVYIYYIWNPAPNHILILAPIWGTLLVILVKTVFERKQMDNVKKAYSLPVTIILILLIVIPTACLFYLEVLELYQVKQNHRIYHWNSERTVFDSTMDPMVFEFDAAMINKYVPNEKAIYIISKYENFLPYFAGKYSAMPYIETFTSLVTSKEISECVNTIAGDKPEFIFVDTDINRNLNTDRYYEKDIIHLLYPSLYDATRGRIIMLNYLRKVYEGIQQNYTPVEKGYLVTTYRKRYNIGSLHE